MDALAAERDVIALDLPGFARSPMPASPEPAGVPRLSDLVLEFTASLGLESFHVAGNSMGGAISLELARRGAVRSATALSPAGFASRPEAARAAALLWTLRRIGLLTAPLAPSLTRSALGRRAALGTAVRHPERVPAEQAALWLDRLNRAAWFDRTLWAILSVKEQFGAVGAVACPVTIAWGEHDRILPPKQAARALQAFRSAAYVLLRDCGHVPTWDDPDQVARVILDGSSV